MKKAMNIDFIVNDAKTLLTELGYKLIMIENSVGTIMKSLQNDLQIYVSDNNINEEDFLVHRELLKKVHFEIRVKEVIPKPIFQTEIVYFLYDFNAIHRNKLKTGPRQAIACFLAALRCRT